MHLRKRLLNGKQWWRTIGLVTCLLVLSFSSLSQTQTRTVTEERADVGKTSVDANATEVQRRAFATSIVISLATDARSYKDLALRPRVL